MYILLDTMGCCWLADKKSLSPNIFRYQTLTALQLSSQTKDGIVAEKISLLQPLTPEKILAMPDAELESLLRGASFHRRKTLYLKQTAKICIEKYGTDIPRSLEDVLSLPGVGPKMAFLLMQSAWYTNEVCRFFPPVSAFF
jgi:endonuclease III